MAKPKTKQIPTTITLTEEHSLLYESTIAGSVQARENMDALKDKGHMLMERSKKLEAEALECEREHNGIQARHFGINKRVYAVIEKAHNVTLPRGGALSKPGEDGRITLTWNAPPKKKATKKAKAKKKTAKKKAAKKAKKKVTKKRSRKTA